MSGNLINRKRKKNMIVISWPKSVLISIHCPCHTKSPVMNFSYSAHYLYTASGINMTLYNLHDLC